MEILKKIIAIVLVSIAAISCSKDDDASAPQTRTNLLLRTTDSDDGLTMDYTYDSNNRLVNFKRNNTVNNPALDQNFTYNADGTLHKISHAVGGATIAEFFYDANKKIIRKEADGGTNVYIYSYNGNEVTENYRYTPTNTGFRQLYIYDDNGNISTVMIYTNTSDANPLGTYNGTINYTYDTKNSATSSLPKGFIFPTSVNNIKTTQINGGGIGQSNYEYNADNYPTKRVDSYTRTYEYQQL
ncbi:MAG: hypothetical protein V4648_08955 [Bacteroidota bacterium]